MIKSIILVLIACFFSVQANALRCRGGLVIEGDSQFRVIKACGAPAFVNSYTKTKYVVYRGYGAAFGHDVQIKVEEWTYNLGSRRLIAILRFENGILRSIETDQGYGFD